MDGGHDLITATLHPKVTRVHRRDDPPFLPGALDYRLFPANVDFSDLVVSHISTNWDRSALQQDPNVVLP